MRYDRCCAEWERARDDCFEELRQVKFQLARAERRIADLRTFIEDIRDKGQGPLAFRIRAREVLARADAAAKETK